MMMPSLSHSARLRPAVLAALCSLCLPRGASAVSLDDLVKSFEDNEEYVQPFATLFGSATNGGWYQSSSVPRGFSFYIGIPITTTLIADDDRSYSGTWEDNGCKQYHEFNPNGAQSCSESTPFKAPTVFGRDKGPVRNSSIYSPISNSIIDTLHIPQNDGNASLAAMNWLPFLEPQISFSYYHTELKLRYFTVPLSSYYLSLPGLGIQHDLSSFLPPLPVSLSVAANWTWMSAEWEPGEDIDGKLELDGTSAFYGVLVGYSPKKWLEVFLETGWETATVKTGGLLTIHNEGEADQVVRPNLTLDGRNGFRAGLNIAFHLGYDAVLGQSVGANLGNQLGVLAYRYKKK
jgi:hypothetical protein